MEIAEKNKNKLLDKRALYYILIILAGSLYSFIMLSVFTKKEGYIHPEYLVSMLINLSVFIPSYFIIGKFLYTDNFNIKSFFKKYLLEIVFKVIIFTLSVVFVVYFTKWDLVLFIFCYILYFFICYITRLYFIIKNLKEKVIINNK